MFVISFGTDLCPMCLAAASPGNTSCSVRSAVMSMRGVGPLKGAAVFQGLSVDLTEVDEDDGGGLLVEILGRWCLWPLLDQWAVYEWVIVDCPVNAVVELSQRHIHSSWLLLS